MGVRGTSFTAGEVHIYRDVDGVWEKLPSAIVGRHPDDSFGTSISLSGDGNVLVIGSPQNNELEQGNGSLQVWKYHEDLEAWLQEGSNIYGMETGGGYGSSVDITDDGKTVIGGAPLSTFDGSVANVGSVTVYRREE